MKKFQKISKILQTSNAVKTNNKYLTILDHNYAKRPLKLNPYRLMIMKNGFWVKDKKVLTRKFLHSLFNSM